MSETMKPCLSCNESASGTCFEHLIPPTLQPSLSVDREAIARIIDPEAWRKSTEWYARIGVPGGYADGDTLKSLDKAEAILALIPDQSAKVLELQGEVERLNVKFLAKVQEYRECISVKEEAQAKVAELSAENERLNIVKSELLLAVAEQREDKQAAQTTIAGMREVFKRIAAITRKPTLSVPNLMEGMALIQDFSDDALTSTNALAPASPWRKMEEVPRDGTEIVLINKFAHCSDVVHWRAEYFKHGLRFDGRFENRSGHSTAFNDGFAWVFWTPSPLPPSGIGGAS